jgi:hypothetical protein
LAISGDLENEPENVIAVVVTDEENEPSGILEKWSSDAWIYADADDLEDLN